MRRSLCLFAVLFFVTVPNTLADGAATWIDPEIEQRIDALLGRMTLAEKVGQLNQYSSSLDEVTGPINEGNREQRERLANGHVGSMLNVVGVEATLAAQKIVVENSRLKIPLIFGYDVIHGYRTIFPVPLAEVASWDLEAIELSARIAATEAAASGVHWTFAPMVDISRDARWGRIVEGAGEDPYLGSVVAAARVRGFQGDDLKALDTVAACAKHLAGYGLAEAGRDYNTVDISDDTLNNVVLPPFKAAVDAGVATLMNAFNEIGGTPATSDVRLQREVLKGAWGFEGFVVSDWGSIGELMPHGVAGSLEHAAQLAIVAGSDMDMESDAYFGHLAGLVESGAVDVGLVDEAVRRVLRIKFHLGLFDDPYRYSDPEREKRVVFSDEHRAAARDVARKSIVLLRNEAAENGKKLLPLAADTPKIAIIGSLALDKDTPIGTWRARGEPNSAVSLLEGMQAASSSDILSAKGTTLAVGERTFVNELTFGEDDGSGFAEALRAARDADLVIYAFGEEGFQTGEGRSQVEIGLVGRQEELLTEILKVNRNVVGVLMSGRPLVLPPVTEDLPALVQAWHLGSEAGHAIADVLYGKHNPSGKLPVTFPRHVGQEPLYYNPKNTGRPGPSDMVFWSHYTDAPNTPRFPFGFGLSYTTFEISKPKLSATEIARDGTLEVKVEVSNTGDVAGAEVVQIYVRDLVGSTTRPIKELKGFERVELNAGASKTVTFSLSASDLAFYTARRTWEAEPGDFEVFVGSSSEDLEMAKFTLQ